MPRRLLNLDTYKRKIDFTGIQYRVLPPLHIGRAKQDMERALEILFPSPKRIFKRRKLPPWDNAVVKRNISIYGGQATGKSHTARWILEQAKKRYRGRKIYAIRHKDDLGALLNNLSPHHKIQVIFGEDLTSALDVLRRSKRSEVAREWYRIRHRLREATGSPYGLIIAILGLHRFHGIPAAFRQDNDLLIFKSIPTSPWDMEIVKRFIGPDGVSFLQQIEAERVHNPDFIAYGVWWHRGEIGVWYNPRARHDYFKVLTDVERLSPREGSSPRELEEIRREDVDGISRSWPKDGKRLFTLIDVKRDLTFREELRPYLLKRGASPETVEMFMSWISGEPQRVIAARKGISQSKVSTVLTDLRERILGYAGEDVYQSRHPGYVRGGENSSTCDFIDHEGKRVISFKTYCDPKYSPRVEHLAKEEIETAKKLGYILILEVHDLLTTTTKTWIVNLDIIEASYSRRC